MKGLASKPLTWLIRGFARALGPHLQTSMSSAGALPAVQAPAPATAPATAVASFRDAQGSTEGWLRPLDADTLIGLVQGEKAVRTMWTQSRLAALVWQRDLLPAVRRYAELVQLVPASEVHHHAHVGGLLAHTIEMVLAAMTWRNGHLLPEGATVEHMDAQRDDWTYVVFFAALLHDVAKILSDLRITWRAKGVGDPVAWSPISGTLPQVIGALADGEYRVAFAPRAQRDYQAHGKLAIVLLQQVAPPTALSFLARNPAALDCLTSYLSGNDRTSLIAKIVQRADQASTQRALLQGSRALFTTVNSVPLVDLLMGAVRDMLRSGALPLNRSGAAGWVYDGGLWLVAKRLADAVRSHLKQQAPDEAVPGEQKNDRLFDTWQDYGCIDLNPATGQAVWHVTIAGGLVAGGLKQEQAAADQYQHDLAVLRFPLAKLYDAPDQYPAPMVGRIEVKAGRSRPAASDAPELSDALGLTDAPGLNVEPAASAPGAAPDLANLQEAAPRPKTAPPSNPRLSPPAPPPKLPAPAFNKPKPAPSSPAPGPAVPMPATAAVAAAPPSANPDDLAPPNVKPAARPVEPLTIGGADNFEADDDWLEPIEEIPHKPPAPRVKASVSAKPQKAGRTEAMAKLSPGLASQTAASPVPARLDGAQDGPGPLAAPAELPPLPPSPQPAGSRDTATALPLLAPGPRSPRVLTPPPVILTPYLPDLPHESPTGPASDVALAFIQWLQTGLAERRIKFNEASALVHFVPEGMALVSPLVFKNFAAAAYPDDSTQSLQVQRAVLKAGWHLVGPGKVNILSYTVLGRGGAAVSRLSAVVLTDPSRWVMPVPPPNPVLELAQPRDDAIPRSGGPPQVTD